MGFNSVGCIHPLQESQLVIKAAEAVKVTTTILQSKGCRIDIPVEQRYWEYGSAMALYMAGSKSGVTPAVLNVGGGWDALTPSLVYVGADVTECEPWAECRADRERVKQALREEGAQGKLIVLDAGWENMPEGKYDFVFCISVLEHVNNEAEAWKALASRVKDGGVFFITTDCVQDANRSYVFDELRVTKYTLPMLRERVESIVAMGFHTIGEPDYQWYGNQVYDYTFFRAGFVKE